MAEEPRAASAGLIMSGYTPTDPSRQTELILRELGALPTLPSVATRLLAVTSADDADLREIVQLIELDPALTSRILSLCQRSELGLGARVTTVSLAVSMLGLLAVQSSVLSVEVMNTLNKAVQSRGSESGVAFDAQGFWTHSIGVACCAELLSKEGSLEGVRKELSFVCGLVHDLGKLALAIVLPQTYERVIQLADIRQCSISAVERAQLGLDHHIAGRRLAEHWSLPYPLGEVMWLHGQPYDALPDSPERKLIGLVTVADMIARDLHLGWSATPPTGADSAEAYCRRLGLPEGAAARVASQAPDKVAERLRSLGVADEASEAMLLAAITKANQRLGRVNVTLDRRSRSSALRGRVLAAIAAFHERGARASSISDAMEAIARSAAQALGEGRYAMVVQERPGRAWRVVRFDSGGAPVGDNEVRPPQASGHDERGDPADLAEFVSASGAGSSIGFARWLSSVIGDDADTMRTLRLTGGPGRPTAVLVHDRELPTQSESGGEREASEYAALIAAWAAQLESAWRLDSARRLGEALTESNRALIEAQRRLAQAESMARLGELTAGAAHEMNNPLAVISGRAQQLVAATQEGSGREAAREVVDASRRLSDLISRLHEFATRREPDRRAVAVLQAAQDAIAEARKRAPQPWGEGGASGVTVAIARDLAPMYVDPGLVESALAEVLLNAMEAGPRNSIELSAAADDETGDLVFTIRDDGVGMDEHALRHAFDPFFSQKPAGRQPGLGLAAAYRNVEAHGGRIELESTPGQGTTARLRLPDWRVDRLQRAA